LLFLSPDEAVLALEVKGTLRVGAVPRLTPSRLRQMSREWLNQPGNPAMSEWELEAEDLYAGVMVVDLATPAYRVALREDFEGYVPVNRRRAARSVARPRPRLKRVSHRRRRYAASGVLCLAARRCHRPPA